MQYTVYRNTGNSQAYPYLLDIQSDLIGELNTRLVIPLHLLKKGASAPVARLTPVIQVEGYDVILMTHEMASVRVKRSWTHLRSGTLSKALWTSCWMVSDRDNERENDETK